MNFVLDYYTVSGEVPGNIPPAALKETILRVLEDHKKDLLDPEIDIEFKGDYDLQFKLTTYIITHLEEKNF